MVPADLAIAKSAVRAAARAMREAEQRYREACERQRAARAAHLVKMTEEGSVTDHAVLRYLDRVEGLPVETIRAAIAAAVRQGRPDGFERVNCGTFVAIVVAETGAVVTIVTDAEPSGSQER